MNANYTSWKDRQHPFIRDMKNSNTVSKSFIVLHSHYRSPCSGFSLHLGPSRRTVDFEAQSGLQECATVSPFSSREPSERLHIDMKSDVQSYF